VFEAVDSAFNPNEHPVSAAVLNNMAKRGEGMVEGAKQELKQTAEDYADIAFYSTHSDTYGAKEKVAAAVKRRMEAPENRVVGMAKGFAGQVKNVGEGLGTVAYYRPELLGAAGMALPSHSKEAGADAKVANAITDIVLDGPQIVLAVEGAANLAEGALGTAGKAPIGGKPSSGPKVSKSSSPPVDPYDVQAWKKYHADNPNAARSAGAAAADDPTVFTVNKHQSSTFKRAKAALKRSSLLDPNLPKHIKGWLKQELNQRGLNPRKWRNPPGYDAGHIDPTDNTRLRWEGAAENRSRGGRFGR
jgi:hypothetical protein